MENPDLNITHSPWSPLYKIAALATMGIVVLIPIQIIIFIIWTPPHGGTVNDWFTLFQHNPLLGLLSLDLLLLVDYVLFVPMFMALYISLKQVNESLMLLATVFGLIGVAAYFASNTAFEMLALSGNYAAASSEMHRNLLLVAGETLLAIYTGTAFYVSYILGSVAGLLISLVMRHSGEYGKLAVYMGILGNTIALGLFIPVIGIFISIFSVLFLEIWYFLIARRLWQLGRQA